MLLSAEALSTTKVVHPESIWPLISEDLTVWLHIGQSTIVARTFRRSSGGTKSAPHLGGFKEIGLQAEAKVEDGRSSLGVECRMSRFGQGSSWGGGDA